MQIGLKIRSRRIPITNVFSPKKNKGWIGLIGVVRTVIQKLKLK